MDDAATREVIRKLQERMYIILCDIDDFCIQNHLRYYLSGGTCLGAVRHHGFIPWDDDLDLMMPRDDYMKFLRLFAEEFKETYYVGSLYTDPGWDRQFAQICFLKVKNELSHLEGKPLGPHLDIFPIDGLPEGKTGQKYYYKKLWLLNVLRIASGRTQFPPREKHGIIKRAAAFCTRPIGPGRFARSMDRYASGFDFNTSKYVAASLPIHYGSRETILKKYMDGEIRIPFEDRELPVPAGYEQYLTNLYGDYMEIPKDPWKDGIKHVDKTTIRLLVPEEKC